LESKSSSPALIRKQGAWGKARFTHDYYSVEDGSKKDFDVGTLGYADAPLLSAVSIFGVGYGVSGGKSLYPQRKFIVLGEQFAVHDDVPSPADPGGLLWAYLHGTRNGFPYHYVAKLPDIVTDVVSFCPNVSPSLYRLPWKPDTLAKITQGNNNGPTHSGGQARAFDFRMPKFTPGYATRGGVVTLVREKRTKQSNPQLVKLFSETSGGKIDLWVPGNTLLIKHQDGTYSYYTHMIKNGVVPKKHDIVERGDRIITVGSTGNVTGPHLHYHVTTTGDTEEEARGKTTLIRFEVALLPKNLGVIPCKVPKRGEAWVSTNRKPTS
jgi:murein DD-endopeptidase MepM/ murein hydrolase activator NlpD